MTETCLREGQKWQLHSQGSLCFKHNGKQRKRGWGFALLATDELRADILEESSTDAIWAELRKKKGGMSFMGLYYRLPNIP